MQLLLPMQTSCYQVFHAICKGIFLSLLYKQYFRMLTLKILFQLLMYSCWGLGSTGENAVDSLYAHAISSLSSNVPIPEDVREDHAQEAPQWGHESAEQNNNTEQVLSCNSLSVQHLSDWALSLPWRHSCHLMTLLRAVIYCQLTEHPLKGILLGYPFRRPNSLLPVLLLTFWALWHS